jgi:hypothetical protein
MKVSTENDNNFGYEKITILVDNIPLNTKLVKNIFNNSSYIISSEKIQTERFLNKRVQLIKLYSWLWQPYSILDWLSNLQIPMNDHQSKFPLHVEQELLTLPEHLSSPLVFSVA